MRNLSKGMSTVLILFAVAVLAALSPPLVSAMPILDSAQSLAVLGNKTVTNGHSKPNPATQVYGNLGVTPGTSVTADDFSNGRSLFGSRGRGRNRNNPAPINTAPIPVPEPSTMLLLVPGLAVLAAFRKRVS